MNVDPSALFFEAIKWILGAIVGLLAWVMKSISGRVTTLEHNMVPREELQYTHKKLHDKLQSKVDKEYMHEYMQRAEVLRTETRQMITALYEKIDTLKDMVIHLSQQLDANGKSKQ